MVAQLATKASQTLHAYTGTIPIRLIHELSITGSIARHPLLMADQAYAIVSSFLLVINSMALYSIWNMVYNLISE